MRVNMDSSVVADPRFKLLGKRLGITWREALGSCFLVWLACYERRSEAMVADELDIAAECDGFASGMVSVGLARPEANGEAYASHSAQAGAVNGSTRLIVHGVKARIAFLEKQRTKGKTGGKRSGKARQNKGVKSQAKREANGSRSAQAYSPAPALTLTPALTPAQKTEDIQTPSESAAATKPAASEVVAKPKTPRKRDPLFDAVAEVTGSDPVVTGSHVGKVTALLRKAEPPYTPEEVRDFAARFAQLCPWSEGRRPTIGEIEKNIGLLRNGQGQQQRPPRGFQTPQDRIRENLIDVCEDEP